MAPETEQASPGRRDRLLAPAIFAVLVLATLAAFAAAQRLKREPLILDKLTLAPVVRGETVFTPNGDGRDDKARIRFRLTVSDRGAVQIIDRDDELVRTLRRGVIISPRGRVVRPVNPAVRLPSFKTLAFRWDGRTDAGSAAPTGPYRLRVKLFGEDRTLVPLGRIRLHARTRIPVPPEAKGAG